MRVSALVAISLLLTTSAYSQNKRAFVCAALHSTGFKEVSDKVWAQGTFKPERFTLTFDGKEAKIKWPGQRSERSYECSTPFFASSPFLFQCVGSFYILTFDEKNLRFIHATAYGYVDAAGDTPVISMGDCQKF